MCAWQAGGDGPDPTAGRHERTRLVGDRGEVGGFGAGAVEGRAHLAHLPGAEAPDGGGQEPGHLGAEGCGDLGRPGEQEVARQDGDQVAPAGIHAADPPPARGFVHHVVVVERPEMDELDGRGPHDHVGRGRRQIRPGGRGGGGEGQCGAETLPTCTDEVTGHLREEGVVGLDRCVQ